MNSHATTVLYGPNFFSDSVAVSFGQTTHLVIGHARQDSPENCLLASDRIFAFFQSYITYGKAKQILQIVGTVKDDWDPAL